MGIITEYLKYQEEYEEKYGERTVVLYQNGSFLEIYEYIPEKDNNDSLSPWPSNKIGHSTEISTLLNMRLTSKSSKKPHSLSNPLMVGFPCIAYEKHRDVLLDNNYTIVKMEQDNKGGKIKRIVTEILSPATVIGDLSKISCNNYIVCIYIEVQKEATIKEDFLLTVGLSSIDVTTGANSVAEVYSKEKDAIYALQELYRFIIHTEPKEIILYLTYKNKNNIESYKKYIETVLELDKSPVYIFNTNNVNVEYFKPNYQNRFLTKLFPENNYGKILVEKNITERLGIERYQYGIVSYILMLQYCYEHDERLIEKIQLPNTSWTDEGKHLILTHNALKQIDLQPPRNIPIYRKTNKKIINSLFSIVDRTTTSLGKRFLSNILSNPITNIKLLNMYYNMTEDLMKDSNILKEINGKLKEIPDLERYQRKLCLRMIKPRELVILFRAYKSIVSLYTIIAESNKKSLKLLLFNQVQDFNYCLKTVLSKYDLESLFLSNIVDESISLAKDKRSILHKGTDSVASEFEKILDEKTCLMKKIVEHLNIFLSSTRGKKIEYTVTGKIKDKNRGMALFTTAHKGKILQKSSYDPDITGELHFINVNKECMITSDIIAETCSKILSIGKEYGDYLYRCYNTTVLELSKYNFYKKISEFVAKVDFIASNSKTAIENKYFKPNIDKDAEYSYLNITDMRHPIVEKIIDTEYITNNACLGSNPIGILLYGCNSCGKSTYAKAIGLNLIMAQSGLYTAGKMKYKPYSKIITRLSGNDNLLQGDSSFVIEMKELRTILRNLDRSTLVLGDELSRGTETVSGTSLTVSAIISMIETKTSFIFSTHMHNLLDVPQISNIPDFKLKVSHLGIKYDSKTSTLIYNRKLNPGSGNSIYGLEVAESLSLPKKFISKAYEIRNWLLQKDKFLSTKKSKYNPDVYIDKCILCGKNGKELQTHHLKEQRKSDSRGYIGISHKNIPGNLTDICKSCHVKLHTKGMKIITHETSKGISFHVK